MPEVAHSVARFPIRPIKEMRFVLIKGLSLIS